MADRIDPPTTDSSTIGRRSKRQRKEVSSYNVKRTLSDMLNPQAKKPKSQRSTGKETFEYRAKDAVENFQSVFTDMQRELQDAKKENGEMSREIKAAQEAKRALADEVLAATEKEREKIVELAAELARCETEIGKGEEKFKRLVTAARGVVESHSKELSEKVGELEQALDGL